MYAAEPEATIYGPQWVRAARRLEDLPDVVRGPFARVFMHMEEGWKLARPMQAEVEALPSPIDGYSPSNVVYYSAQVLIVDLYRWLAFEIAEAVPDMAGGFAPNVNLDDVESESELFLRYLILTALAIEHPSVTEHVRARLHAPIVGLKAWTLIFWRHFKEMADTLVAMDLPLGPSKRRR